MKKFSTLMTCVFLIFASSCNAANSTVKISDIDSAVLTIENDCLKRQYQIKPNFAPIAIIDKQTGQKCEGQPQSFFEIGVNGELLNSAQYVNHTERQMAHGGTEITFKLKSGPIDLNYIVHIFPNCPVSRERMEFTSDTAKLTYIDGKARLVFPRYTFKKTENAQEIKLASWTAEQMPCADLNAFPVMRPWGTDRGINLSQCHMYHPVITDFAPSTSKDSKGPIVIGSDGKTSWIIAYEHGSADEMDDFLVISTDNTDAGTTAAVKAVRGAYLNSQKITPETPYKTQWINLGLIPGDIEAAKAAFWQYLYKWQSENSTTRRPAIYYNTWGWQVDDSRETKAKTPDILKNEKGLHEEIDYAHQIGVDIFVIDDGWFDYPGDWNINTDAFPNGFSAIKERLDSYGMRMGLWMAAYYVHPKSEIIKQHPEWIKKSKDGKFAKAKNKNWGLMACQVSGYSDFLVEKCKHYMDMGFTYFKWDGMESNPCYADHHNHGNADHTPSERAERYGFEIINFITEAAKKLTDIDPNLIIVYDVTEKDRNVGLEFFSVGRYFWMNNGGSFYGDLSTHRASSMRTVPNLYAGIIPQILMTYANYPHNKAGYDNYQASYYNACTTFLGGNGFWGDLSETSKSTRNELQELVSMYKKAAKVSHSVEPKITGSVGSSPEIYEYLDPEKAQGQIIAFSGSVLKYPYLTEKINEENFLGVLRHAYQLQDSRIKLDFQFTEPQSARPAFILGQNTLGPRIVKSTCWLKDIQLENNSLTITAGAPGTITVFWPDKIDDFELSPFLDYFAEKFKNGSMINITFEKPDQEVTIH